MTDGRQDSVEEDGDEGGAAEQKDAEDSDVDRGNHLVAVDKGLTNTLYYDSDKDAIVKNYDINPSQGVTRALAVVAYGVKFKPNLHTKNKRMKKEIELKQLIEQSIDDEVVNSPDVKERRGSSIAYEYVDGVDAREYLEENPEYAYLVGEMVGKAITELHENEISQIDSRPENWLISSDEDGLNLYLVDHEYSDSDISRDLTDGVSKMIDRGMFLQGVQQMDEDVYRDVKRGMEETAGDVNSFEDTVKAAASVCNAALIEKDTKKFSKAAKNGVKDVASKITEFAEKYR